MTWNKDIVDDRKIFDDLREYSKGNIELNEDDIKLMEQRTFVPRKARPAMNNNNRRYTKNN